MVFNHGIYKIRDFICTNKNCNISCGLVNTIKDVLIEFAIPNLSLIYFWISEFFKTSI